VGYWDKRQLKYIFVAIRVNMNNNSVVFRQESSFKKMRKATIAVDTNKTDKNLKKK